MESTEHFLQERHLAGCLRLSQSANWNQNEADWRVMLAYGRGWGVTLADGTLAASTLALPYGGKFAWVSMVLVLPGHRRQGYASRLLRQALAENSASGLASILDATPAGHAVYVQEGFRDTWGFSRFSLSSQSGKNVQENAIRPIAESDWPAILELDQCAFGASREELLRNLESRLPAAALVVRREGRLAGFLLGRDGREACQLGPLVARDPQTAELLLNAGLERVGAPVYVDVADHAPGLQAWTRSQGFEIQRPFTRMVVGTDRAPGDESLVYCPAGPELG
ncbi:MAG: GNAT family N-acetyltransferase [Candidatus Parcubacteria bacterium]|nr:GNAT family N-acetyltransferase [Burkholderiales bacterium]